MSRHAFPALGYARVPVGLSPEAASTLQQEVGRLLRTGGSRQDGEGEPYWVGDAYQGSSAVRALVHDVLLPLWQELLGPDVELLLNRHNCFRWSTRSAPSYWHRDTGARQAGLLTSITYLMDSDASNGWTEIVPGSHLRPDADEHDAYALPVPARAGDTLLMDSRLVHRSTPYRSGPVRHALLFAVRVPDDLASPEHRATVALTPPRPCSGHPFTPWNGGS